MGGFDMAGSRKLIMTADTRSDLLMHLKNRAYDYCIAFWNKNRLEEAKHLSII